MAHMGIIERVFGWCFRGTIGFIWGIMGVYMGIIGCIWWYMGLHISMRLHLVVFQHQVYFWWGPHNMDYSIFVAYRGLYPAPPQLFGKIVEEL